jgi:hypothetical protein
VRNLKYKIWRAFTSGGRTVREIQLRRWFEELQRSERAKQPGRLLACGYSVFSQCDEDGIIQEIFRRIGTGDRRFIEFGSEDGSQCNSALLLTTGWSGLWIDGSARYVDNARKSTQGLPIEARQLWITSENIDDALGSWAAGRPDKPAEIDLLSIDIDGNDYWIWRAIQSVTPRVVIVEYNASYPPPIEFTQPYDSASTWDGSNYFGASLSALTKLANEKGYSLVGCTLSGVNAFFVRNDLLEDGGRQLFHAPNVAEEHYEPPRYQLGEMKFGHPARLGPNGTGGRVRRAVREPVNYGE